MAVWIRERIEIAGVAVEAECAEGSEVVHISWSVPDEFVSDDHLALSSDQQTVVRNVLARLETLTKLVRNAALVLSWIDAVSEVERRTLTNKLNAHYGHALIDPVVDLERAASLLSIRGLITKKQITPRYEWRCVRRVPKDGG